MSLNVAASCLCTSDTLLACSACLWEWVCVRTLETIAQSQCATLGLVPQCSLSALALLYLWTKGCSERNDLAPVSHSRRTRDEQRKRSEMWKAKWWSLSVRWWREQQSKKRKRGKIKEGREKVQTRKRVGVKENLQFRSGTSHSSCSCEQFSLGNDGFYFCGVFCLTLVHRNWAWPSGPVSKPSLITEVSITTDEADLHRWQHREVNFASASSSLAVCFSFNTSIPTLIKNRKIHKPAMCCECAGQALIAQQRMICLRLENKLRCQNTISENPQKTTTLDVVPSSSTVQI